MASKAAAALLDELMGRNRNLASDEKSKELRWDDAEVCKRYLCGFCPHELFVNTRADLGPCDKIHDEALRKEYLTSSRFQRMGYAEEFLRFLQGILNDVERRIRRGEARLSFNAEKTNPNNAMPAKYEEKIGMLSEKVNGLLQQAEQLGLEGKVEEAQGVMKLCEQLKDERESLRMTAEIATSQEKQMEVCKICGAFLIVGDAQSRIDDHLMGKQHVGYARIRATVEEMIRKRNAPDEERETRRHQRDVERQQQDEERKKQRDERDKELEKEREEQKKQRDEERSRERKRSDSRERERSRSREQRRRSSRERSRRSSVSRDRRRRSRSRDRRRRSSKSHDRRRSRSRDRQDRSRHRRDGSKSRARKHRSSSRERRSRHRSRSRSHSRDRRHSGQRNEDKRSRSQSQDKEKREPEKRAESEKRESKERDEALGIKDADNSNDHQAKEDLQNSVSMETTPEQAHTDSGAGDCSTMTDSPQMQALLQ
ncbi:PREDICTED: luc7-like protein 3 [Priapulus caudatus]|uniref:Luc7-like protein 3 n=1 Tax=Priapulus caudatus TaxID=37621 RepID=A0ABM1DTC2_PRICU|nr:PREDICTED: luc7-like protein 3 [Priapulus caudatus]